MNYSIAVIQSPLIETTASIDMREFEDENRERFMQRCGPPQAKSFVDDIGLEDGTKSTDISQSL